MKLRLAVLALAAAAALAGCRRADIREFTVEIPDLAQSNQRTVMRALAKQPGIDSSSYKWDFDRHTLTLKYDSMQVAQTNIRMAIEAKGLKVVYPENTTGRAGH